MRSLQFALTTLNFIIIIINFFRSAIEVLEAELKESTCDMNLVPIERGFCHQQTTDASEILRKQENIVSARGVCYTCNSYINNSQLYDICLVACVVEC